MTFPSCFKMKTHKIVSELRFFSPLESMQVTIILHSLLYSINTIKAYNFLGTGGSMETRQAKILLLGT